MQSGHGGLPLLLGPGMGKWGGWALGAESLQVGACQAGWARGGSGTPLWVLAGCSPSSGSVSLWLSLIPSVLPSSSEDSFVLLPCSAWLGIWVGWVDGLEWPLIQQ